MLDKIKNLYKSPYVQQFRDTKAVGLAIFGVMAVAITWSGVKTVQTNYALQRQISRLEQENEVKQLENNNLRLKNQYLETDQFLELAARRQFGKGAKGEQLLIVPRDVAVSYAAAGVDKNRAMRKETSNKAAYQKNLEAWINFFLNRPNAE